MASYSDEIKLNVEEAVNHLQAAKNLYENGQLEAVAARASESAFHMASALLLDEDIEISQHGDVITLIQEIFVNGRLLTKEQGGDLSWLFAMRNAEDRALSIRVTPEEAHRAVEIAESFFEAAKVILEG
ncbi:MAG TPA: HEPN domain-containing protein [Anaerolineales bacterium]|nr:HEPN domain-containing protein [Anaerolineales bacterium]